MPRSDPEKLFATREEALEARDRLNREPPEYGYSPWFVHEPVGDPPKWPVARMHGLMAKEVGGDPKAYEEGLRRAVEDSASHREYWRKLEAIEIESVFTEGEYPDTRLAVVFRPVTGIVGRDPSSDCRFGYRVEIWPAQYADPETEADFWSIYFQEYIGKSRRARRVWEGPCQPDEVDWLT
jgi:hypothetical protein